MADKNIIIEENFLYRQTFLKYNNIEERLNNVSDTELFVSESDTHLACFYNSLLFQWIRTQ